MNRSRDGCTVRDWVWGDLRMSNLQRKLDHWLVQVDGATLRQWLLRILFTGIGCGLLAISIADRL